MTREEAIYEIKQLAVLSTDKEIPKITEALDMAIEALQREDAEVNGYCHRIKPKGGEDE